MSVSLTVEQARAAAFRLRVDASRLADVVDEVATLSSLSMEGLESSALALGDEAIAELEMLAELLEVRATAIEFADHGFSTGGSYLMGEITRLAAELVSSLDDDRGVSSGEATRARVERVVFGADGVPTAPPGVVDAELWRAEHVTAVVLDELGASDVEDYWAALSLDQQFAVIQTVPGAVSDRVLADQIVVDEVQRFALLVQPIDPRRLPLTGPGTDYLGQPIPQVDVGDEGDTVRLLDSGDDVDVDFMPDNPVCTVIQAASLVPSAPDRSVVGLAAAGYNIHGTVTTAYTIVKTSTAPLKAISPASWAATFADVALCRLTIGSADPISTGRVVDDDGTMVYEHSRSESQPYMDPNGLPLSPTLEGRDKQRWLTEHQGANWAPYPGYPAYPEFAPED